MGNPNPNQEHLKPWQPGESGNPAGKKPGTKHLSTWIQEMMNDETFEIWLTDVRQGFVKYEGVPIKAIVGTAMKKAAAGDKQWADWIANNGWKQQVDITSDGEKLGVTLSAEQADQLIRARAKRTDT